jgi:hypothetical protein
LPQLYEKIKAEYQAKGKSDKDSKSIAAAIYNTIKKNHPSMAKLSNKKGAK